MIPASPVRVLASCRMCLGSGTANIGSLGEPGDVPIAKYLEDGIPCSCAAGIRFADQSAQFHKQGVGSR